MNYFWYDLIKWETTQNGWILMMLQGEGYSGTFAKIMYSVLSSVVVSKKAGLGSQTLNLHKQQLFVLFY